MSHYPTISDVLNSPCGSLNQHLESSKLSAPKKVVKARNDCKEVQWIAWQLKEWCKDDYIVIPELRFDKKRRYRFDFAIMKGVTEEQARKFQYDKSNIICGIEYQGGVFMEKSGHSNPTGATRDCDKSNLAQSLGWPLLTFTVLNYQQVIDSVQAIMKYKSLKSKYNIEITEK